MELAGKEKNLKALFSELKTADQQTTPRFAAVWHRAEIQPRRMRAFNPAVAAVTACVLCAIVSFFVWSRYSRSTTPPSIARVETPMVEPVSVDHVNQAAIAVSTLLKPNRPMRANRPSQRNAAQLAALRRLTREAKAISDWASPTSTLLSFTGDELVTSLPQLDENASDLKSFLPSRPK